MKLSRRLFLEGVAALSIALAVPAIAQAEDFKMGLLVPGSVSEEGWNRIGYNALKGVESQLSLRVPVATAAPGGAPAGSMAHGHKH